MSTRNPIRRAPKAPTVLPLLCALFLALIVASAPPAAQAVSSGIVISQVYGGGGNTGAPYTNDYVELFNRGGSTVSLAGWSIQYTSATGTGNFGSSNTLITPLAGSLNAGQYMLVQEAGGANGSPLPTPDVTDSTPINMAAAGGKVALVNSTTPLGCNGGSTPCSASALAMIVDLIGWDGANFFEGSGPGPTTSNTTAALRLVGGCDDTDYNSADFTAGSPNPRNTASPLNPCPADLPPKVVSTSPANSSTGIALDADITIKFSEAVNVAGAWFSISCANSGSHTATAGGGPTDFTLDPDVDFTGNESCTVTVLASQVTDQDTIDPPDNMAANFVFSFTTITPPTFIHDIQGASHTSPMNGASVTNVNGIVTAKRSNGFYMQDPNPDSNEATSEGIFVFTSSAPGVNVGDAVRVGGTVQEFRAGGAGGVANLTTTELGGPGLAVQVLSSGNQLPAPVIIGSGGRLPPSTVIEDDATGDVETSGIFDPGSDGIDFYESLESMWVQVNDAVVVGPWHDFTSNREIPIIGDNGANASVRTYRGGIVLRAADPNPERIILNDLISGGPTLPPANVGDSFPGATIGVMDYSFGNFKLEVASLPSLVSGGLAKEATTPQSANQLSLATFNVENLDPGDGPAKFDSLASLIVDNLKSPDLVAVEEIQDNDGATDNGVVDATNTYNTLIAAIQSAGGPAYQFRQINPVNDQDGGEPGGNIRQGFLFRTDRGLSFVDRPGGNPTTGVTVVGSGPNTQLSFSPGRIDPTNAAFNTSRKPLAGEFMFRGLHLFVIANHLNSKSGDQPLFGHFQPPATSSETQRHQQAQIVHDFVNSLVSADPTADVVVLGDLNDFQFSETLNILKGSLLHTLIDTLPVNKRYSYDFDGNSEAIDHTLLSDDLFNGGFYQYAVIHVNSEFAVQASDHEPQVVKYQLYDFSGFFKPLANPPTLNQANAGSLIPVKFSLGGNKGLGILDAGYPKSQLIDCGSLSPLGNLLKAATAGSSGLSYDASTKQYTYGWKTDKAWAATCRQLIVKLNDGTIHLANFSFK